MAVYAAHLTRARGDAPSVFLVAAEQALAADVKPALRRLVQYTASKHPSLEWAERWFDELYLLLDAALQYHYLKHYAASFSESFYGLMRVASAGTTREFGAARLPAAAEWGSLAALTLLPYLLDRAAPLLDCWRQRQDEGLLGKRAGDRARLACVRAQSGLALACGAWRLARLAGYAAGRGAPSPQLAALRLRLVAAPPPPPDEQACSDLRFPELGALALRAAQYAAFGVQLLRWWDDRAPAARPLPPPPLPQRAASSQRANTCPLCRERWRAPTALTVSGYVFCYTCIARSLRAAPRCPVSGCPARSEQLVRLYVQ